MKKRTILLLVLTAMTTVVVKAQTWTGTTGTAWNVADNWSPATVPISTGNVVIPGALTNYPVLAGNVTINSINMQSGSRLDVNGFSFTLYGVSATTVFSGATLNNSNEATDIQISLSTGSSGYLSYFRSNTVNDAIVFTITGSNDFFEGDIEVPNQYNGNATFNINGTLPVYISNASSSQFNGDLTINRTIAGPTGLFYAGAEITGDFAYANNAGGATVMGVTGIKTGVGGTVNITAGNISSNVFVLRRIINQTNGGSINVQNSQGFLLEMDTLLLSTLNITGYRGSQYSSLLSNKITGNLTLSDDATYGGGYHTVLRSNEINGNTSITINGPNTFFEGDIPGSAGKYFGNLVFDCEGGIMNIASGDSLKCTGDVSISRSSGSNNISAFNGGATIDGNFSYTNNFMGHTVLGNPAVKTMIGGQVNIGVNFITPHSFVMQRLINQAAGGNIMVRNSRGFYLCRDTLIVNSVTITGYGGGEFAFMFNNRINGNVTLADDATYSGGYSTHLRSNEITGDASFTNNGSNNFFDADVAGSCNRYNGNVTFNGAGSGLLFIAEQDSLYCTGDLSINRTAAAHTQAFNSGATIKGNFSYSNSTSGNTIFGNTVVRTSIGGTMNIAVNFSTPAVFQLSRFINQTSGGIIGVQNSSGFYVVGDTLAIAALNISGYKSGHYGQLLNNSITGDVTLADDVTYGGGYSTYLRNNVITGNSNFTNNGTNHFYDADNSGGGNRYYGNVAFTGAGSGDLYIASGDSLFCSGNVTINRTAAGLTLAFGSGATINGDFSYNNSTTGDTYLGTGARTSIGGTVNITANYTSPARFSTVGLINQTGGGNVTVQNSLGFYLVRDTLKLNSLSITGYKPGLHGEFYFNDITANVTITDDATFGSGYNTYVRNNVITGSTFFTSNGTGNLHESWSSAFGNKYIGNVSFTRNDGNIYVGQSEFTEVTRDLVVNSTTGISLGSIKFNGNTDGVIEQLGSQPVNIAFLETGKTGSGKITLNDPLTVSNNAAFISGNIHSSTGNELIFQSGSTYTGGSDASYVDGPVTKIGAGAFTFPVGNSNKLAPISISATGIGTDAFRATYHKADPYTASYDTSLRDPLLHHTSGNEYWLLDRTAGTSNVFVTLSWDTSRSGNVNYMPDLRIARWNGSMWKDEGNGGTTGTNAAGTVQTAAAVNTFSPFTLASASPLNALPVNFLFFNAVPGSGQSVLLQWKTAEEVNNAYFELQKSADGRNWVTLSIVYPQPSHEYSYTDKPVSGGINYYRVKQVDTDGKYTYSAVKAIRINGDNRLFAWPNPATDNLFVQTQFVKGSLEITDVNGRTLWSGTINYPVTTVPVQQLPQGLYLIRTIQNGEVFTQKFIKH